MKPGKNTDKTNLAISRRSFLKVSGTAAGSIVAASCSKPVEQAIPFVIQPENIEPGESQFYNTFFYNGDEWGLVKVRTVNGRPVKIEGNPSCPFSGGGTSAISQAAVLDLYDENRFKSPLIKQKPVQFTELDEVIEKELDEINKSGKTVALLMPSVFSPSTKKVLQLFTNRYPNTQVFFHDKVSYSALLEASKKLFDEDCIPAFRFGNTDVIVSINADFLGTWLDPVSFTRQYAMRKNDKQKAFYHLQIEAGMSLTGSNADERIIMNPAQESHLLATVFNKLAKMTGTVKQLSTDFSIQNSAAAEKLTNLLFQNRGNSILISGTNRLEIQFLVLGINHILGNFGKTINFTEGYKHRQSCTNQVDEFIKLVKSGETAGTICIESNPVYDFQYDTDFVTAFQKQGFTIALADRPDETTNLAKFICPAAHFLESWCDYEIRKDFFTWQQPVIQPLFGARQYQSSLLKWTGIETNFQNLVEENAILLISGSTQSNFQNIEQFKHILAEDGYLRKFTEEDNNTESRFIDYTIFENLHISKESNLMVQTCQSVNIGSGRFAANPWLQELPDPVTKICWDNYAAISASLAKRFSLADGDIILLNKKLEIPVFIQQGQEDDTISVVTGYGKWVHTGVQEPVGVAVNCLFSSFEENSYGNIEVWNIEKTGKKHTFALAQKHHSQEGRNIARYMEDKNLKIQDSVKETADLYPAYEYQHNRWGMVVDLNVCTGCNACVVACQAENNIPVVGKSEVEKGRIMHWIKIDRYYDNNTENPLTIRQPVICQHCGNAPCENVCPVAATNHSAEGINQMVYNRCVGTRYCNNNCPYNVRVFNWRNYTGTGFFPRKKYDPANMTGNIRRLVLNPDVTVRSNGVIEKCSFCIQRIQSAKIQAKKENRPLTDGEFTTACAQACTAGAIIFGNLNNPESIVNKVKDHDSAYSLLGELNTKPSVTYLGRKKPQNRNISTNGKI
jgi:molybdopterin-containing oxidoreductase family iron-sulfur binding subunit